MMKAKGHFEEKRNRQQRYRLYETINQSLKDHFYNDPLIVEELKKNRRIPGLKKNDLVPGSHPFAGHLLWP